MWYIKDSPIQLADIRYIVNGEEREQKAIPCQVKTFDQAKELIGVRIPEAELTYFHVLTEQELLEQQSEEYNKSLRDEQARAIICRDIAEALKVIGSYEKTFFEQLLATEQAAGEKNLAECGGSLKTALALAGYSDWRVGTEAIKTAIEVLPFIDKHREQVSKVCIDVENRRKALETPTN